MNLKSNRLFKKKKSTQSNNIVKFQNFKDKKISEKLSERYKNKLHINELTSERSESTGYTKIIEQLSPKL